MGVLPFLFWYFIEAQSYVDDPGAWESRYQSDEMLRLLFYWSIIGTAGLNILLPDAFDLTKVDQILFWQGVGVWLWSIFGFPFAILNFFLPTTWIIVVIVGQLPKEILTELGPMINS